MYIYAPTVYIYIYIYPVEEVPRLVLDRRAKRFTSDALASSQPSEAWGGPREFGLQRKKALVLGADVYIRCIHIVYHMP